MTIMDNIAKIENHESLIDKYCMLLSSLDSEDKLSLIERLTQTLHKKMSKDSNDMSFISKITGAWDDGTSVEEKMKEARN